MQQLQIMLDFVAAHFAPFEAIARGVVGSVARSGGR